VAIAFQCRRWQHTFLQQEASDKGLVRRQKQSLALRTLSCGPCTRLHSRTLFCNKNDKTICNKNNKNLKGGRCEKSDALPMAEPFVTKVGVDLVQVMCIRSDPDAHSSKVQFLTPRQTGPISGRENVFKQESGISLDIGKSTAKPDSFTREFGLPGLHLQCWVSLSFPPSGRSRGSPVCYSITLRLRGFC
jgi:hypothetical protein